VYSALPGFPLVLLFADFGSPSLLPDQGRLDDTAGNRLRPENTGKSLSTCEKSSCEYSSVFGSSCDDQQFEPYSYT
jgi:hypothetical protein